MKKYKFLNFKQLGDDRGNLVVIQELQNIPFEIKRIFYIYGTKEDVIRGQHANKHSEFILINIAGKCKVKIDDGINEEIITLNSPSQGIYLEKMVWKDMFDFSEDAVLLVLSNELYNSEEYIRDYFQFKKLILKEGNSIESSI